MSSRLLVSASKPQAGRRPRPGSVIAEAAIGHADTIGAHQVEMLLDEFLARILLDVFRFGGKPDGEWRRRERGDARENVGVLYKFQRHALGIFLELLRRGLHRPVVGHGRHADKNVRLVDMRVDGIVHFLRVGDADDPHTFGIGQDGRAGDQDHFRAGRHRGCGHRVAHAPGAFVGNTAHWVDGLPGWAGGDDDGEAVEFTGFEQFRGERGKFRRFEHASGADVATGL